MTSYRDAALDVVYLMLQHPPIARSLASKAQRAEQRRTHTPANNLPQPRHLPNRDAVPNKHGEVSIVKYIYWKNREGVHSRLK